MAEGPGRGLGDTRWGDWGWHSINGMCVCVCPWGQWDMGTLEWLTGGGGAVGSGPELGGGGGDNQHELGTTGTFPPTAPNPCQTPPQLQLPGVHTRARAGWGVPQPQGWPGHCPQPQSGGKAGGWPALPPPLPTPPAEALTPGAVELLSSAHCRFKGLYPGRAVGGGGPA